MDLPEVILNLSACTLGFRDYAVRCDIPRKRSFVKYGVNDSLRVTVPEPPHQNLEGRVCHALLRERSVLRFKLFI